MRVQKIALAILVVLFAGFSSVGTASAGITDGLVAYYPFNGNANDESGNGYNGTVTGAVLTTDRLGNANSAYNFSNNGDVIVIGNPAAFQMQDFSIAAWVKRGSTTVAGYGSGGDGGILAYGSQGYGLGMFADGRLYLTKIDIDNVSSSALITDQNWHHVVVTKTGVNVTFYIDGAPAGSPQYYNSFQFNTNMAIGTRGDLSPAASFLGSIDEVRLYNRALTADEVALLSDTSVAGCISLKGSPVGSAPVTLKQIGERNQTTSTDGNGCYKFANSSIVSGKTFTIEISGPMVP